MSQNLKPYTANVEVVLGNTWKCNRKTLYSLEEKDNPYEKRWHYRFCLETESGYLIKVSSGTQEITVM